MARVFVIAMVRCSYYHLFLYQSQTQWRQPMAGLFYRLGRKAGPKLRKARWMWQSLFGSEAEILAAENAVGNDLYAEVVKQVPQTEDAELKTLVSNIATQLAGRVRSQGRTYQATVIRDAKPNAFALPGGYVFLTSSILDLCQRQKDQIAFIVAHEMAYIVKQHAMERIVAHSAVSFASNLPSFRTAISGWARKAGMSALQSSYSQDHELDADAWAARLSRAAGFNAQGGIDLLSSLAKMSPQHEPGEIGKYFSSHPPVSTRVAAIRRALQDSG
jgi:beta-barrel assembly-enhancing protease